MKSKSDKLLTLLLVLFVFEGLVFVIITPPFEAPDENHHLNYINYFAKNFELPVQNRLGKNVVGEGHQNPLYYMICGALVRLFSPNNEIHYLIKPNKIHIWNGGKEFHSALFKVNSRIFPSFTDKVLFYFLRMLSVLFGFLTLYFITKTLILFKSENIVIITAFSFIAFLPQFIFINSVISNDSLSFLLCSVSVYYLFYSEKKNYRVNEILFTFVFLALSVLTKFYAIGFFLLFVFFFYLEIRSLPNKDLRRKIAMKIFIGVVIFIILLSPLFLRNYFFYKNIFGYNVIVIGNQGLFSLDLREVLKQFANLFISFYGKFGWGNVTLPLAIYILYGFVYLYFILILIKHRKIILSKKTNLIAIAGILIVFLEIIYYNLSNIQLQGRFLFPALSFIVLLIYEILQVLFSQTEANISFFKTVIVANFLFSIFGLIFQYSFYH